MGINDKVFNDVCSYRTSILKSVDKVLGNTDKRADDRMITYQRSLQRMGPQRARGS